VLDKSRCPAALATDSRFRLLGHEAAHDRLSHRILRSPFVGGRIFDMIYEQESQLVLTRMTELLHLGSHGNWLSSPVSRSFGTHPNICEGAAIPAL
jgi:hypothetical protein